jgi:hypothetical protein
MAVVEVGPLATTQRLGIATFRDLMMDPPDVAQARAGVDFVLAIVLVAQSKGEFSSSTG